MNNHFSFKEAIKEDLKMHSIVPSRWRVIWALIFKPSFACIFCYRLNRSIYRKSRILGRLFHVWRYYTFANDISYFAEIGPGCHLSHTVGIVIGSGVVVGRNSTIYHNVTLGAKHFDRLSEKPTIGDNVIIGVGACVLGNITIGNNVEIGALTFCDRSVPDNSVVYGKPLVIKPKN